MEEGGKWVPFGSTTPTHTVTEANEGLGLGSPTKTCNDPGGDWQLGVGGLDPGYHQDTIMFHLGSLVELP